MKNSLGDVNPKLARTVSSHLNRIEKRLLCEAQADTEFVSAAASHIIKAGGKRFRPTLVVLSSQLGSQARKEDVCNASVVVELTHVASLYHDDVMDEAALRRGVPSANAKWGNLTAILVGDYLFARASAVVADLGADYVALQARTFQRLVQGQIAETEGPRGNQDPLAHYLQVVADKTGSLISTSAVFGAMVAGLPDEQIEALRLFGEEVGAIFQLGDDIIDIVSDESGKTPGADLKAGVPTLPTLLVRQLARPQDGRLLELLDGGINTDAHVQEALTLLRSHPALAQARSDVIRRSELARSYLAPLPKVPARDALEALCDTVVTRSS
ncbi:MAG: polyprenyl synthetase family protein [Propionibacteriaceae bacterium]|nr:polyprenyl synthetase family protein [Propionibacteriaceae bacterium]